MQSSSSNPLFTVFDSTIVYLAEDDSLIVCSVFFTNDVIHLGIDVAESIMARIMKKKKHFAIYFSTLICFFEKQGE